ncbi:Centractin [Rhizina undulata]
MIRHLLTLIPPLLWLNTISAVLFPLGHTFCMPTIGQAVIWALLIRSVGLREGLVEARHDLDSSDKPMSAKRPFQMWLKTGKHPVLLAEASSNFNANRDTAAQLFFESFNVPALFTSIQAVLSLFAPRIPLHPFASERTTRIVFDLGDCVSHTVPVYEGFAMPSAIRRIDVAKRDVTKNLQLLLRETGALSHPSAEKKFVRLIKERPAT